MSERSSKKLLKKKNKSKKLELTFILQVVFKCIAMQNYVYFFMAMICYIKSFLNVIFLFF